MLCNGGRTSRQPKVLKAARQSLAEGRRHTGTDLVSEEMDVVRLGPSESQKVTGGSFDLPKDLGSLEGLKQGNDMIRFGV